jgi:hypothetical protein
VDWMHLAQDRDQRQALMNMLMDLRVSEKVENFVTIYVTIGFSAAWS